jgi:hypothetical protein
MSGLQGGWYDRRPERELSAAAGARKDRALLQSKNRPLLASCVLAFAAFGSNVAASAEGRLEARYSATLAGIPIGSGSWTIEAAETQYTATVNGSTSGLLRAFTGGQGNATSRSTLNGGKLISSIYAATITTRKYTESIRITINNGNVKDFRIEPPPETDPERVPVTDTHQHNVLDPMTASLVRMSGNGDILAPEACDRTLAVFDGRLRYDLQFAFKRMENVKAKKGYAGPAVVCAAFFSPIAGFIPSRSAIKYLAKQREMEVWLAPIAGTRVLVPYRAQSPTPVGQAVVEASEFVSVPLHTRASANGTKTQ